MSVYSTCRPLLQEARAEQPDPSVPVWDFEFRGWPWSTGWRAFPRLQESVLRAFLTESPACYLQMDPSDVLDWSPAKAWDRPYSETFQLPMSVDPAALTKAVLHVGGYRLYCAPAPVEPSLLRSDPWRTAPDELLGMTRNLGISAFLAAHYDDDSWRLVFPSEGESA
jgi:hypothetical protein